MTLLTVPAHCLDADFEANILKQYQVKIIDRSNEPWSVVFEGSSESLVSMYNENWGDQPIGVESDFLSEPTLSKKVRTL